MKLMEIPQMKSELVSLNTSLCDSQIDSSQLEKNSIKLKENNDSILENSRMKSSFSYIKKKTIDLNH